MSFFNTSRHCGRHSQGDMRLAEVVMREIQSNHSFKVFKLFSESIDQPRETATMHPQSVVLLLDMRGCNPAHVPQTVHDGLFRLNDFCRPDAAALGQHGDYCHFLFGWKVICHNVIRCFGDFMYSI